MPVNKETDLAYYNLFYVFFPCIYIYFIAYNRNFEAILVLLPEGVSIHAWRYTFFYQMSLIFIGHTGQKNSKKILTVGNPNRIMKRIEMAY